MLHTRSNNISYILASDLAQDEINQTFKDNCLKVKLLHPNALLPKRHYEEDAGYDLYSPESYLLKARQKIKIPIGISIELPKCHIPGHIYCFRIISRSGLSAKYSIEIGAGLIDASYRGELSVILYNHSDYDYIINANDKIAQGIVLPVAIPEVLEVTELTNTIRGNGGFGSTGFGNDKKN